MTGTPNLTIEQFDDRHPPPIHCSRLTGVLVRHPHPAMGPRYTLTTPWGEFSGHTLREAVDRAEAESQRILNARARALFGAPPADTTTPTDPTEEMDHD